MQVLLRRHPGLRSLPHVDLGVRPTPVEEREIDGVRFLVKRDDLTSALYGGNKARPLEFLLARPGDRVLTFTALGAHHAYATAVHAETIGKRTIAVVLRKGTPGPMLERLPSVCEDVVTVGGPVRAALATARRWRPGTIVVPPGGMSPTGALGYVVAALELPRVPERIYVPLGTGTTVSGLLAGLALRGARTELVAVRVADAVAGCPHLIRRRARAALRILRRHDPSVPPFRDDGIDLRVVRAEGAYGEPTPAALAAVEAARPLVLEPTYTGKTLAVLLGERPADALFVHTYCAGAANGPGE